MVSPEVRSRLYKKPAVPWTAGQRMVLRGKGRTRPQGPRWAAPNPSSRYVVSLDLPHQPTGAQGPELSGHGEAQVVVVVQIGLLLLSLNALALLKLFPGLTGLVASGLIVGAAALAGKHRNTPLARSSPPLLEKTTGALQPNADHASGRKAPEVFSAGEKGADKV